MRALRSPRRFVTQSRCDRKRHGPDKAPLPLEERTDLLEGASWATWDSGQNLWVARPGIVEQYTLDDLRVGTPSYSLDVDEFEPPPKPDRSVERQS